MEELFMKCPNCDSEVISGAKFCSNCGAELTLEQPIENVEPTELGNETTNDSITENIEPEKKNNTAQIIITAFIIIIVIVAIIISIKSTGNESENADYASSEVTDEYDAYDAYDEFDESEQTTTTTRATTTTKAITTTKSEAELKIETQKEKEKYISKCIEISYNDLARNPNKYIGEKLKITVEVSQILSGYLFSSNGYRCYEDYDIYSDDTYFEKEWYIDYYLDENEPRILEDDVITFYGTYEGTVGLERSLTGTTEYIPNLDAKYCEIITDTDNKSTTPTTTKPKITTANTSTTTPEEKLYNPSSVNNWSANGTGDYVAQGLIINHCGVLSITYDGSGYFSVKAHNINTGDYELLVNDIGPYNGTVLIPESGNYDVEINADGNWTATAYAIGTTNGCTFSGHGDAVTSVFYTQNQNWKITNSNSESYFSVKSYYTKEDGDYDLIVSEIGNYNGIVRSDNSGSMFFEIVSDGDWTISPVN